jgi:hypothetical protein
MKGMKGLVNIIPSMISAIPNPIDVFSAKLVSDILPMQESRLSVADEAVYDYLAFEKTLDDSS